MNIVYENNGCLLQQTAHKNKSQGKNGVFRDKSGGTEINI